MVIKKTNVKKNLTLFLSFFFWNLLFIAFSLLWPLTVEQEIDRVETRESNRTSSLFQIAMQLSMVWIVTPRHLRRLTALYIHPLDKFKPAPVNMSLIGHVSCFRVIEYKTCTLIALAMTLFGHATLLNMLQYASLLGNQCKSHSLRKRSL